MDATEKRCKSIINEIDRIRAVDPTHAEKLSRILIAEGKNVGSDYLLCHGEYFRAEAMFRLGKPIAQVLPHITKANTLARLVNQPVIEARAKNMLGVLFTNEGDCQTALDCFLDALAVLAGRHTDYIRRIINNNIGNLYLNSGDYKTALRYFKQGYRECLAKEVRSKGKKKADDKNTWILNLASTYYYMGKYEEAKNIIGTVDLIMGGQFSNNFFPVVYGIYARLCYKMGDYEGAINHAKNLLLVAERGISQTDSFNEYIEVGMILIEMGEMDMAKELIQILSKICSDVDNLYQFKMLHALSIEFYKKQNNQQKLIEVYETYYQCTIQLEERNKRNKRIALNNKLELKKAVEEQQRIQQKNKMLQIQTEHDPLTGIANRYYMNHICDEKFKEAREKKKSFGIIILDIDYFKEYNDTYGHLQGDECLKCIGRVLKSIEAANVFVARYGGDEFFVITYDKTLEEMKKLAETIQEGIRNCGMEHKCSPLSVVSITQGVICDEPKEEQCVRDFIHFADIALYKAKADKRGTIGYYVGKKR